MNAQDAILAFLRSEEAKFDKGSDDPKIGVDGRERCRAKASALRTAIAYIERGDHLAAVERTPETVLRAMLADEERQRADALRRFYEASEMSAAEDVAIEDARAAAKRIDDLHHALARRLTGYGDFFLAMSEPTRTDYAARLAGTRPLNAPPLDP